MKKALGLAVALTLAMSLSAAAAEQTKGTVESVNPSDQSIVLDDGTRLWVSGGQFTQVSIGSQVQATYEMKGDKKVVTRIYRDLGRERAAQVQGD